jgi:hypothetical protein
MAGSDFLLSRAQNSAKIGSADQQISESPPDSSIFIIRMAGASL